MKLTTKQLQTFMTYLSEAREAQKGDRHIRESILNEVGPDPSRVYPRVGRDIVSEKYRPVIESLVSQFSAEVMTTLSNSIDKDLSYEMPTGDYAGGFDEYLMQNPEVIEEFEAKLITMLTDLANDAVETLINSVESY